MKTPPPEPVAALTLLLRIRLYSMAALEPPELHHAYLSHENGHDAAAIGIVNVVVEQTLGEGLAER